MESHAFMAGEKSERKTIIPKSDFWVSNFVQFSGCISFIQTYTSVITFVMSCHISEAWSDGVSSCAWGIVKSGPMKRFVKHPYRVKLRTSSVMFVAWHKLLHLESTHGGSLDWHKLGSSGIVCASLVFTAAVSVKSFVRVGLFLLLLIYSKVSGW